MLRAVYHGRVLAEAPRTVRVEGNHYFPPDSVRPGHFTDSTTKTLCPWKGIARYHHLSAGGAEIPDAAWYYPHPSPFARRIRGHISFDPIVEIEGAPEGPGGGTFGRLWRLVVGARGSTDTESGARLPVWRIGLTGGLVGISCCAGPAVLTLLGVISAGTAYSWATDLYDSYAWLFRLGGLAALALLVWLTLRRRDECSIAGVRRWKWRLAGVLGVAVATYVALYVATTWLGSLA